MIGKVTKITKEIYLDKAQNGARTLFDLFNYRLLDGVKDKWDENDELIRQQQELKEIVNI